LCNRLGDKRSLFFFIFTCHMIFFIFWFMKLPGSFQSRVICWQAHNDKRPEPCESLTVVHHAPGDLVTVGNSLLNVCQLDICQLLSSLL
jgi:hypothetical protein